MTEKIIINEDKFIVLYYTDETRKLVNKIEIYTPKSFPTLDKY
jgi:hypothetical protein